MKSYLPEKEKKTEKRVMKRKRVCAVVVVYQCTIINLMVSLGELKLFCITKSTLCKNVRNLDAAFSLNYPIITSPWPGFG